MPINALVAVEGTPLAGRPPIDPLELVRMIATTRIVMPKSRVRLSAGRSALSREAQVLCLVAGANSIFYGEKLLTAGNPGVDTPMRRCSRRWRGGRRAGRSFSPRAREKGRQAPEPLPKHS